jgi:ribosomal protein S27AE
MPRPERVSLTCPHCGHRWLAHTSAILQARMIVYRGERAIEQRRVPCPNCDKGVIVDVPQAWLEESGDG